MQYSCENSLSSEVSDVLIMNNRLLQYFGNMAHKPGSAVGVEGKLAYCPVVGRVHAHLCSKQREATE